MDMYCELNNFEMKATTISSLFALSHVEYGDKFYKSLKSIELLSTRILRCLGQWTMGKGGVIILLSIKLPPLALFIKFTKDVILECSSKIFIFNSANGISLQFD